MGDLAAVAAKLDRIVDDAAVDRIRREMADAAVRAAEDVAAGALGGDRAFSGMRTRIPLRARRGADGNVTLEPGGLWVLADQGRRRGTAGGIRPVRARALSTPQGPRALSTVGAWAGKRAIANAFDKAGTEAPRAGAAQIHDELARHFGSG